MQSLIVADSPSPLDSIKEGFSRIFHFKNDRKLPFYSLVGPSIAYHLAYYLIYNVTREALLYLHRKSEEEELRRYCRSTSKRTRTFTSASETGGGDQQKPVFMNTFDDGIGDGNTVSDAQLLPPPDDSQRDLLTELKCSLYANIITDILLYPFQTVLYR